MTGYFCMAGEGFFLWFLRSARMLAQSIGIDMRGDVQQGMAQLDIVSASYACQAATAMAVIIPAYCARISVAR